MILSKFGEKMTQKSGILQLMDDLGNALQSDKPINMLGGGNPAVIPAANRIFQQVFQSLGDGFLHSAGNYSTPQGDKAFLLALADFLNRHYDWNISEKNIALTNGSQNAFFCLFNLFSGRYSDGSSKNILLPLAPEYVGYADVHTEGNYFVAGKPGIELLDYTTAAGEVVDGFFKYHVDFATLPIDDSIGAICCSRPTNPTGNVLTDAEMAKLARLASDNNIPLIVDNAYGMPFPSIIFGDATLTWDSNTIMCLSLSKIGLPGLRTGIVVANEAVIQALSSLNAIVNLAPTRLGAAIAAPLLQDDRMKTLAEEHIRPFYRQKVDYAIRLLKEAFADIPLKIHHPEGAIFLWLWFPELPITTFELYQQLKSAGTIILPGEYFFPGTDNLAAYRHAHECIRMSYAQSDETLQKGIAQMAEFVRRAYA
ncbi:MAG: valine--pyruvate transaminase [Gammaproteobacteria bacterium]|nr:MAG: valine--pyruvate transaminase [Gammaproteobacteria bacterium]